MYNSIVWPQQRSISKESLLILLGILVLGIAGQISIPLKPVPLTFQSATVILIGMLYGYKRGTTIVGLYLLAGISGVPLWANMSGGIHHLFGPTGGYLLGFLPAVAVSGYLAERGWSQNIFSAFIAACIGASILFIFGVIVLSHFVGWSQAWLFGVKPFIFTEIIKLLAVAICVPSFWKES